MGEVTGIAWTDSTINFWHGCTKVGPGCDHCYAEKQDARFGPSHWGTGVARKKIKSAIQTLHRLDNGYADWAADYQCAKGNAAAFGLPPPSFGPKRRVFVSSMADFFDNEVDPAWRAEAWDVMKRCNRVEFQVLTKRIGNADKMIEGDWPGHIGLMATIVNQEEADRDIPKLLKIKAERGVPWVGLSMEPLLGPVDIFPYLRPTKVYEGGFEDDLDAADLDWVIVGGESGPGYRPMEIEWAESIANQCREAGTAFFFKQDHGPRSGLRGRASDALWARKAFP